MDWLIVRAPTEQHILIAWNHCPSYSIPQKICGWQLSEKLISVHLVSEPICLTNCSGVLNCQAKPHLWQISLISDCNLHYFQDFKLVDQRLKSSPNCFKDLWLVRFYTQLFPRFQISWSQSKIFTQLFQRIEIVRPNRLSDGCSWSVVGEWVHQKETNRIDQKETKCWWVAKSNSVTNPPNNY